MADKQTHLAASIEMFGPSGAGKTTILDSLETAADLSDTGCHVSPSAQAYDAATAEALDRFQRLGITPTSTTGPQRYRRTLAVPRLHPTLADGYRRVLDRLGAAKDGRWPWPVRALRRLLGGPDHLFALEGIDYPGSYTLDQIFGDDLLEQFVKARGLVYVYYRRAEERPRGRGLSGVTLGATTDGAYHNADYLRRMATNLRLYYERQGQPLPDGRYPGPLAFVINKIDEHATCRQLWAKGLIAVGRRKDRDWPYVVDPRAAYEELVDLETRRALEDFFDLNRVGVFPASAHGFFVDEDGHFDYRNSCNGVQTEQGYLVLSERPRPYNVIEAILWLGRRIVAAA